jgi:hypothetical protein
MAQDIFDINWKAFSVLKKGKFYSKKNEDRFNCYETHFIEYTEASKKVTIEVYIQLIPARGTGPFLERKTTLQINFLDSPLQKLSIVTKTFFNQLFNKKKAIEISNSNFEKKYLVIGEPKTITESMFSNTQFIIDLLSLKLNNLELRENSLEKGWQLIAEFPGILFEKDDINIIDRIAKHLVQII